MVPINAPEKNGTLILSNLSFLPFIIKICLIAVVLFILHYFLCIGAVSKKLVMCLLFGAFSQLTEPFRQQHKWWQTNECEYYSGIFSILKRLQSIWGTIYWEDIPDPDSHKYPVSSAIATQLPDIWKINKTQ